MNDKDCLRFYLYNISMESVKEIGSGIQRLKQSLNVHPNDLDSFVLFVKEVNEGTEKKDALNDARRLAQEQKDCLNRYKNKDPTRPTIVNNQAIIRLSTNLDQVATSLMGASDGSSLEVDLMNAK
jgi:hypothetical protein